MLSGLTWRAKADRRAAAVVEELMYRETSSLCECNEMTGAHADQRQCRTGEMELVVVTMRRDRSKGRVGKWPEEQQEEDKISPSFKSFVLYNSK